VRGHADAETLAAFREELLSRRKAARVSAHLAACSRCAALDAQLAEVSALLTRSAAPPMPDALTARIEAAIAAEAATRAATAADGAVAADPAGGGNGSRDGAARPSRRPGGPRRSWLALRVAAVTAAVVVVAGGGYGVARLLSGSPSLETAAGTGAPAANSSSRSPSVSAGLRAPGSQAAGGGSVPGAPVVSSGTDYQPGQLKAQVSAALARFGENAMVGPSPGPSGASRASGAVLPTPACVSHVTGGKRPILVDQARYQGRPATVIVVPGATSGTLRALVIAGDCTATTSHLLAIATLPRPG
jgi:anti-sigma factor RsiW